MLQTIDGIPVYVVEFSEVPGYVYSEDGWSAPYAEALTQAIKDRIITKPGKYGIHIYLDRPRDTRETSSVKYAVYQIVE